MAIWITLLISKYFIWRLFDPDTCMSQELCGCGALPVFCGHLRQGQPAPDGRLFSCHQSFKSFLFGEFEHTLFFWSPFKQSL